MALNDTKQILIEGRGVTRIIDNGYEVWSTGANAPTSIEFNQTLADRVDAVIGAVVGELTVNGDAPVALSIADGHTAFALEGRTIILRSVPPAADYPLTIRAKNAATSGFEQTITVQLDDNIAAGPGQFTGSQWSVANSAGGVATDVTLIINSLPVANGSAITDLEYSIDNGASWVSIGQDSAGTYTVDLGVSDSVSMRIRAVNGVDNGPASAAKTVNVGALPTAFAVGDWTLSKNAGGDSGYLDIEILTIPDDGYGGGDLTAIQCRIDGGTAFALSGTEAGTYSIAVLGESDVEIRPVTVIGEGAWSDVKTQDPAHYTTSIAEFSHDKTMFDSGFFTHGANLETAPDEAFGATLETYLDPVADSASLPTGVTRSGTVVTVDGTFDGSSPISGFDLRGYTISLTGTHFAAEQCLFGEDPAAKSTGTFLNGATTSGTANGAGQVISSAGSITHFSLDRCTAYGAEDFRGHVGLVYLGDVNADTVAVTDCLVIGFAFDAVKLGGAATSCVMSGTRIRYTRNYPAGTKAYDAGVTYNTGDVCFSAAGHIMVSLTDGNVGNTPPTTANGSNANWRGPDPHVDGFNAPVVRGAGLVLHANSIVNDAAVGGNRAIWIIPNAGADVPMHDVTITNNCVEGGWTFPVMVDKTDSTDRTPGVTITGNSFAGTGGAHYKSFGAVEDFAELELVFGDNWNNRLREPMSFDSAFYSVFEVNGYGKSTSNRAMVPVAGSIVEAGASAGEAVMCRIIDQDGATVIDAHQIGTTDANGDWTGEVAVERHAKYLTREVWIGINEAASVTATNRFGVGSVTFEEEQSNGARGVDSAFDKVEAPSIAIADDEAVQVIRVDHSTEIVPTVSDFHNVTDAARYSVGVSYRAASWIAKFPGHKLLMAFDMKSGTAQQEILDDGTANRYWTVSKGLADLIHTDGTEVGLVIDTHENSAPLGGRQYGSYLARAWFGKELDGTDAPAKPYAMGSFTNDHDWTEAYPEVAAGRAMLAIGQNPWPFVANNDGMASNAIMSDGTRLSRGSNPDLASLGRLDIQKSVHGKQVRIMGWSGLFESGYPNEAGDAWLDGGHFSNFRGKDGMPGYQTWRLMAGVMPFAQTDFKNPVFDQSYWELSGAYVEFWSSEGDITTIAKIEGYAALDGTEDQHTEVLGFDIDGYFAHRAEIVDESGNPASAGRVRIYPRTGETFGPGTVIDYKSTLNNRGHGMANDERFDLHYRYRPLVDVGVPGFYGLHVDNLPIAELNKGNLAGKSFTKEGDGGFVTDAIFETEQATILLKGFQARFGEDQIGYGQIIRWENDANRGGRIDISHNRVRVTFPGWDGWPHFDGYLTFPVDALQDYLYAKDGVLPDIRIVYNGQADDGASGTCAQARLFIDDVEISATNAAGLGITESGSAFGADNVSVATTTSLDERLFLFETDHYAIEEFSIWKQANTDGSLPADDTNLFCRMTADGAGGFELTGMTKV